MSSFIIKQGTDSGMYWPVLKSGTNAPVNFVGWTGEAQLRSVNSDRLLYTFSTATGTMLLGDSKVTLLWTNAVTSAWTWNQAKYGIELTSPDGKKVRIKQGIVTLSRENVR